MISHSFELSTFTGSMEGCRDLFSMDSFVAQFFKWSKSGLPLEALLRYSTTSYIQVWSWQVVLEPMSLLFSWNSLAPRSCTKYPVLNNATSNFYEITRQTGGKNDEKGLGRDPLQRGSTNAREIFPFLITGTLLAASYRRARHCSLNPL